ncbi:MAG: hypothetical protein KDA60_06860 [Planctomycetales bacterium]|nr:hypothetical protein [Planctomycetales bacterium]
MSGEGLREANRQKILAALDKPATFDFFGATLADVVDNLSTQYEFSVEIDTREIEDEGLVDLSERIDMQLDKVTLRSGLRLLLNRLGLDYYLENEVLMISTPSKVQNNPDTRIYNVRELLPKDGADSAVQQLIKVLRNAVEPSSWEENGGTGTIGHYQGLFVVSQTGAVHEQLEDLLEYLAATMKDAGGPISPTLPQSNRPQPSR